jgi:hypothetical protein
MVKFILIIHPDAVIKKILARVIQTQCDDELRKRQWNNLQIRDMACLEEAVSSEEKKDAGIIITHLDSVEPDGGDLANVRQLRLEGIRAPLIALAFSDRNAHQILSKKAHALLTYPFRIDTLRTTLSDIKILNSGDMDYIQEQFCDERYREVLCKMILHDVSHKDWAKVKTNLDKYEQCFGMNGHLGKLLQESEGSLRTWERALRDTKGNGNV